MKKGRERGDRRRETREEKERGGKGREIRVLPKANERTHRFS